MGWLSCYVLILTAALLSAAYSVKTVKYTILLILKWNDQSLNSKNDFELSSDCIGDLNDGKTLRLLFMLILEKKNWTNLNSGYQNKYTNLYWIYFIAIVLNK